VSQEDAGPFVLSPVHKQSLLIHGQIFLPSPRACDSEAGTPRGEGSK
jgi:hypothetical protein